MSIADLAQIVSSAVGFSGKLTFDRSKPDGTPRKLMDNSLLKQLGWNPKISLKEGVAATVSWYVESLKGQHIRH